MPGPEGPIAGGASLASDPLSGGVVRPLLVCPDPDLRRPCDPAGYLAASEMKRLAADLLATLRSAGGDGISAPQIGVPRRLIVVSGAEAGGAVLVLSDPELVSADGPLAEAEERCLSWPGGAARPARADRITVAWYDLDGCHVRQDFSGHVARVVQRQLDVLAGRFIGGF